jgi:hypothetical protein
MTFFKDKTWKNYHSDQFNGKDINLGTTVQPCSAKSSDGDKEKTPSISIRACLFFDGTLNNRTNVALGKLGKSLGDSYDNELSNIALLANYWLDDENTDLSFSAYVEGIGTINERSDSIAGAVTGMFETGICAKAESGIAQTAEYIVKNSPGGVPIKDITLDVFGFSRGAAAARYFVYHVLQNKGYTLKERLTNLGYSVGIVKIEFVGLFDTVAAYGLQYEDNSSDLHLDSISCAGKVVQLAAAEEYRKHFQLTNIKSAVNGIEIFLPGTHSDIGGGYIKTYNEEGLQILDIDRIFGLTRDDKAVFERERKWLLESGWYLDHEINDLGFWNELKVNRNCICNYYSLIPLKLMTNYASENDVQFDDQSVDDLPIPEELIEIQEAIIMSCPTTPDYWLKLNNRMMKDLRHGYLHFSAYYGSTLGANEPQFTADDPVKGQRKRVIKDG